MPSLLGMNFQSVSTAQKLPTSGGQPGGYQANRTPGPVLAPTASGQAAEEPVGADPSSTKPLI